MAKKLYVGNLPFSVTSEKLKELFSEYGEISEATVIINKFSGRSKGFGFVTFSQDSDAEKAVSEMNGKDFEGRKLTVNEAKPFEPGTQRKSFGGDRGGRGFGRSRGFGGERRFGGPRKPFKRRSEEGSESEESEGEDDYQEE